MQQKNPSLFEKHPKTTISILVVVLFSLIYGLISIKFINEKSIKTVVQQYYVGNIIDNNVGRFIKLREHRPNTVRYERPSRNYIKNITPNTVERKYYKIETDPDGFIRPSDIYESPDLKIVFLGGSTTECLYMDETKRFPYLVGRQLEKALYKKTNAYNGGVSANESMHSLNILMNKVLPLKPDVVVLMHNINDLVMLRSQGSYWYLNSLKSHVQTAKNVFAPHEFPPTKIVFNEEDIKKEFSNNLKTFIAICRIRHIQPVLMTQANRVEGDKLYHTFNQIIREVAKNESVPVIDLDVSIPKTTDILYDSYHYTVKGSALAARTISEELLKHIHTN